MTNIKNYGNLYVVATPLGNLKDITFRAIETLKAVDKIVCEDTRVSSKLLNFYDIKKPLISYNNVSEHNKTNEIILLLKSGLNLAIISDAGTPIISDPGFLLIKECYKESIKVVGIPGPSALTLSLSMAPVPSNAFVFLGFLDKSKSKQINIFNKYKNLDLTIIFYESPNRLVKTLQNIAETYGENQEVVIARELTKIFEEIKALPTKNLIELYTQQPPKGEIVVLLKPEINNNNKSINIEELILQKMDNYAPNLLAKELAKQYNLNKNDIYKKIIALKNNKNDIKNN